jgi:hypothetical protein
VRRIAPGALSRSPEGISPKDLRFAFEPGRRLAGSFSRSQIRHSGKFSRNRK